MRCLYHELTKDRLIATVAALTLSIRVLGGAIGYAIYFIVFVQKFTGNAIEYLGAASLQAEYYRARRDQDSHWPHCHRPAPCDEATSSG
jgi:hypothetical protein